MEVAVQRRAEAAIHRTGKYPDWWQGRRWDRPVRAWARWDVTRDALQRLLVGEPKDQSQWGTGFPAHWWTGQDGRDALDSVIVKHSPGGNSTLGFKSYDQRRTKWQGETLDFVWFDEEPPQLTRTNATGGF